MFGHEAVLALVPSAPQWPRHDAIDIAAALLASRSKPTERHSFYRVTTRQRTCRKGWKQTYTDLGGGVLAWSFEDHPAFESDQRLWVGAAGGNILKSEVRDMARIEKDGKFGWYTADAAPEEIDALCQRLLAPPPPSRSDRPWSLLGRIAADVARQALS